MPLSAFSTVPRTLVHDRSVVVIGAGSEVGSSDYSALIEGVDTVVRINPRACKTGLSLSSVQHRHTTGRIDLAYHHGAAMGERFPGCRGSLITLHPVACLEVPTLSAFAASGCKAIMVNPHRVDAARARCAAMEKVCPVLPYHGPYPEGLACPTTGHGAIQDLLRLRPRELYIVGFDCYHGGKTYVDGHLNRGIPSDGDPRDYAPSPGQRRVGPHDFAAELASLHRMCSANADTVRITPHLRDVFQEEGYDPTSLQVVHLSAK